MGGVVDLWSEITDMNAFALYTGQPNLAMYFCCDNGYCKMLSLL